MRKEYIIAVKLIYLFYCLIKKFVKLLSNSAWRKGIALFELYDDIPNVPWY